jgi:hypothetical protein
MPRFRPIDHDVDHHCTDVAVDHLIDFAFGYGWYGLLADPACEWGHSGSYLVDYFGEPAGWINVGVDHRNDFGNEPKLSVSCDFEPNLQIATLRFECYSDPEDRSPKLAKRSSAQPVVDLVP